MRRSLVMSFDGATSGFIIVAGGATLLPDVSIVAR
jgi:hypothetical protein